MIAKVITITPTGKEPWNSPNGPLYSFSVELSDGCHGDVNSTRAEGPPYHIGDEVEYSVTNEHPKYGKKLKIKKADGGVHAKGGSGYDPLPGFCATNIAFCINEIRKDTGEENFSMDQLVDKMHNLHKMHAELTDKVRERLKD